MTRKDKIQSLEDLAALLAAKRAEQSVRVIHCHGVFDLLHIGHIRYLERARSLGDCLVVTLTPDRFVNKGPHRPTFSADLRADALAALDCVDYVSINQWPTAVETIRLLRPDFYAKGAEYRENRTEEIVREEEVVAETGSELAYIDEPTSSSTYLVNRHFSVFPEDVKNYLRDFVDKHPVDEVLASLEDVRCLKVLVLGDAILDEYQYCDAIGKSSKEPVLAAKYLSTEMSAGGVLAVGNHVAGFCDDVELMTFLGDRESHEDYIRSKLRANIRFDPLQKENAPTIIKRRFVESYFLSKFFEIYVINDREIEGGEEQTLCDRLEAVLPGVDVVIVADFGHGMITPRVVQLLCAKAPFLAVNTQVNAGNQGFNTIAKFPRADFICLAEKEVRMEMRNRHGDLGDMIREISTRLQCPRMMVTMGKDGCIGYSDGTFTDAPALATRIVDRIGAGDAVFSLVSLCVAIGVPMEVVCFIGNAVGAQAVAIMANEKAVDSTSLSRHITSLLK
ncbi:MAG: PfkB family carbohydrate kinase [Candidatus Latescibacterota bacterium]|nr:PfkB family carbohydrate kinase [Candidatus Latescibacterota bacterium]